MQEVVFQSIFEYFNESVLVYLLFYLIFFKRVVDFSETAVLSSTNKRTEEVE